jgi:hypothetical protein
MSESMSESESPAGQRFSQLPTSTASRLAGFVLCVSRTRSLLVCCAIITHSRLFAAFFATSPTGRHAKRPRQRAASLRSLLRNVPDRPTRQAPTAESPSLRSLLRNVPDRPTDLRRCLARSADAAATTVRTRATPAGCRRCRRHHHSRFCRAGCCGLMTQVSRGGRRLTGKTCPNTDARALSSRRLAGQKAAAASEAAFLHIQQLREGTARLFVTADGNLIVEQTTASGYT